MALTVMGTAGSRVILGSVSGICFSLKVYSASRFSPQDARPARILDTENKRVSAICRLGLIFGPFFATIKE